MSCHLGRTMSIYLLMSGPLDRMLYSLLQVTSVLGLSTCAWPPARGCHPDFLSDSRLSLGTRHGLSLRLDLVSLSEPGGLLKGGPHRLSGPLSLPGYLPA